MSLAQQIKDEMKEAMKAKDAVRLTVLRGLIAGFTNELVAQKRKPQEEIDDDSALNVIRRSVKQRKDSIEQFTQGGRSDLVAAEEAELAVLQSYIPAMMSRDDIRAAAQKKQQELGVTDKTKLGMLVGAVMKDLKGKADGADVKEVVESLFA
jgi:uncharacterized protein YqeY